MRKWQITLIVTVFFSSVAVAGGAWTQRPIIDYKIDGALDIWHLSEKSMSLSLKIRNRGKIDASLTLIVRTINANITLPKVEPWIEYNETEVRFHVSLQNQMETYGRHHISIIPIETAQNFTVTYTIEDASPLSIPNGFISHLFLERHGYYPTTLTYNRTEADTYELIK